ncbi:TPA: cephalosporin hydroxylase family protein [Bacillus cereus]|uniref:CmcI family methyltransferase n=1 Tax=Bacillus TaxID=1386 RepID=UPI00111E1EE2|nr:MULTISPECIES: CmcI family methyltransferase [Bacillus]MCG3422632.1 cephalosporin hydroxylase family protein [Bacillus thuringiensis]MCP1181118.1 cephalosporin hydroxylase family protein [Bacillus sp. 1663tsa1]MCP1284118.1 cephalosporin hydroxylase family protein [Bacillus sp. S0635]MCQ6349350.1 cephalosporin hydroxylase family protein [Bacillus cereus]MCU5463384.1 cephalosporin hydroxylase family protein [Bacillus cereus]
MDTISNEFLKLYYDSNVWLHDTHWLGVPILKLPSDLFLYQEIIYELKPDLIIECGTCYGGSALYLASILDLIGKGHVVTIDIFPQPNRPSHDRITYVTASSVSVQAVQTILNMRKPADVILVILDSDHSKEHVAKELLLYQSIVTTGSYIIVEDTSINGNPVYPDWGPGPMEAVEEFLATNKNFIIDESKHKFFISFNPKGFLKKIK